MRALLPHLKPYRLQLATGPIFKLVEAVIELLNPLIMAAIIDRGIRMGDRALVWRHGLLLLLLTVVGLSFSLLTQYMASVASQGTGTSLRSALFARAIRLDDETGQAFGTASLTNRLTNDINQIQVAVAMTIRLLTRAPFLAIGGIIMSFSISRRLSLILVVAVPLATVLLWLIMRWAISSYRQVQTALDRVGSLVRDHMAGVRVIRAFRREADERRRFATENERLERLTNRAAAVSALMNPVTQLIFNMAIVIVLARGATAVDTGHVTQGEMLALTNYLGQIVLAMMVVANLALLFPRAFAAASRVSEVLETPIKTTISAKPEPTTAPLLVCRHLSFRYPGAADPVLSDIDLTLDRGETLGVIGTTGAGKSTLLDLILRFREPFAGEVRFHGRTAAASSLDHWRGRMAWAPQRAVLLAGSIRDNLLLGLDPADYTDADLHLALERAQALDFVLRLPESLDSRVERGGTNFSGGQRQRLSLARVLLRPADLLLLDDAFSALDNLTEQKLRREIAALPARPAVIVVSQRVHTIRACDRILLLDQGRVAGLASHAELVRESSLYREIVRSQSPTGEVF
ncbi:MAG: ABC transporter ATP-binding protein [Bacillota bacterium]|nr:ABC transporter ATP-binding protein [Bacillota bacterium]